MRDPINKNNAIYYDSIKSYPNDFRGVKWESPESQFLRFKILCEISPLLFQSFVLDVGCGMGHLVDYLQTNNFTGDYQGIDLCNEMILSAQKRHPAFYFENNDIESVPEKSVAYILASGIFAFVNWRLLKQTIALLFSRCSQGAAFNCLSAYTPKNKKHKQFFYPKPGELFDFCKTLTPHVTLRHDYLENDFTLYLYQVKS